jgi:hypothetical protein
MHMRRPKDDPRDSRVSRQSPFFEDKFVLMGGYFIHIPHSPDEVIPRGRYSTGPSSKGYKKPIPAADVDDICAVGINGFYVGYGSPRDDILEDLCEKRGMVVWSFVVKDLWAIWEKSPERADADAERMAQAVARYGDKVIWNLSSEIAAYVDLPETFESRQAAYEFIKDFYLNRFWGKILPAIKRYAQKHGLSLHDFNLATQGANHPWVLHYFPEWGSDMISLEVHANLPNIQIGIAFARGAAQQHGVRWAVDLSANAGPLRSVARYDSDGRCLGGLSEWSDVAELVTVFYAGSYFGARENTPQSWFYHDAEGRRHRSALGDAHARFAQYALHRRPARGRPHVICAVMLDYYHGWSPRDHRVWWGSLPYTDGDKMIDNFFNGVFPDQEDAGRLRCKPWTRKFDIHPFPWTSKLDAWEKERAGAYDRRPYEKGDLTDSPWGDSFDIVLNNCSPSALQAYPMVLLLGDITLTAELKQTLTAYAEGGGTVVVNMAHVSQEDEAFLGVEFTGKTWFADQAVSHLTGEYFEDRYSKHPQSYPHVRPTDAETLIAGGVTLNPDEAKRTKRFEFTAGDDAFATRRRVGDGEIIFTTLPYMQRIPDVPFEASYMHLLEYLFTRFGLVEVAGPPIHYMVNVSDTHLIVCLFNHGAGPDRNLESRVWEGELILQREKVGEIVSAEEWYEEETLPFAQDETEIRVPLTVEPFQFRIVALGT